MKNHFSPALSEKQVPGSSEKETRLDSHKCHPTMQKISKVMGRRVVNNKQGWREPMTSITSVKARRKTSPTLQGGGKRSKIISSVVERDVGRHMELVVVGCLPTGSGKKLREDSGRPKTQEEHFISEKNSASRKSTLQER